MNSNTSVTGYLGMTVGRFYDTWQALCEVSERRAKKMKEKTKHGATGKRRRR